MDKLLDLHSAIDVIKSEHVVASSGFRWSGSPELLLNGLGEKFR